jgi:peroxiredoxin Q/BCP
MKSPASLPTLVLLAALAAGCESTASAPPPSSAPPATQPAGTFAQPSPAEVEQAAMRSSKAVGRPAPPFALQSADDQTVRLADLRGKWVVLYFYPADDTPGCTCQATEFTQLLTDFRDVNAAVVGISTDRPADHRHFREKYAIGLTLLSDADQEVAKAYGAWAPGALGSIGGRTLRQTFLIDPQGNIAKHWPEVIPQGHAERVRDALRATSSAR